MAIPARSTKTWIRLTRPAQGLQEEKGICEQLLQPVVRPRDKTQRQCERRLQVEGIGRQHGEIELIAGRRAE